MTTPAPAEAPVEIPELRRLIWAIAYRMLGSVADAEDVVQEALLRLHRAQAQGTRVEQPKAYLAAVATRLSIDRLRSARARREQYVGEWLPEPVVAERGAPVERRLELRESLSLAFLVLLETLSPVERAVFLLREVFDFGYDEIARIVEKSEDNCRQVLVRAKRRVEARKPRFESSAAQRDELARRFFAACEAGNLEGVLALLAADTAFHGDGGGKAVAITQPVFGRERVARLLAGFLAKGWQVPVHLRAVEVNGQPGVLVLDAQERLINVLALAIAEGAVQAIHSIVNPDKLGHLGPLSDVARLDAPK